jgi:hypothetical protein
MVSSDRYHNVSALEMGCKFLFILLKSKSILLIASLIPEFNKHGTTSDIFSGPTCKCLKLIKSEVTRPRTRQLLIP